MKMKQDEDYIVVAYLRCDTSVFFCIVPFYTHATYGALALARILLPVFLGMPARPDDGWSSEISYVVSMVCTSCRE